MVLKTISPGCGVQAFLMLFYQYLMLSGRSCHFGVLHDQMVFQSFILLSILVTRPVRPGPTLVSFLSCLGYCWKSFIYIADVY